MTLTTDLFIEERDALHEHIAECLLGVAELRNAIQDEDFETAERLGTSFGDDLRLMEDLGWGCPPVGEAVKLTMAPEQLHRVFTRIRSEVGDRSGTDERSRLITEACERILGVVGRTPPPHLTGDRDGEEDDLAESVVGGGVGLFGRQLFGTSRKSPTSRFRPRRRPSRPQVPGSTD